MDQKKKVVRDGFISPTVGQRGKRNKGCKACETDNVEAHCRCSTTPQTAAYLSPTPGATCKAVSLIVPVSGEEHLIEETLNHFLSLEADELIVVEGGRKDRAEDIIRMNFPQVQYRYLSEAHRAKQMNEGARVSQSDILVFSHADMRFPTEAVSQIKRSIGQGFVGGGFFKTYFPSNRALRIYNWFLNTIYLTLFKRLVGTNGVFVTKDTFNQLGGFPEVSFMEDVLFSKKLAKAGSLAVIKDRVQVSSRRYMSRGALKQIWINGQVMMRYCFFGQKPEELKMKYEQDQ